MKITISATAAVCTALFLAPAVKADPFSAADAEYLQELNIAGINPATMHAPNLDAEVSLGHSICNDLAKGRSPSDLQSHIEQALPNFRTTLQNGLSLSQMVITIAVVN
jgi:hypothetical protein